MTDTIVSRAAEFAREMHEGQVRKYTGDPYFVHLEEVANLVRYAGMDADVQAAAYLHDVIEDTAVTTKDLVTKFNPNVANLVWGVTDQSRPEDGNRATRKTIDRLHVAQGNAEIHTIKVADLISNTKSIVEHDPHFSKIYLKEKELLLPLLTRAQPGLLVYAWKVLNKAKEKRYK